MVLKFTEKHKEILSQQKMGFDPCDDITYEQLEKLYDLICGLIDEKIYSDDLCYYEAIHDIVQEQL